MMTSMEIRSQQFNRGMRGFKEEEVRNFLALVAQDYEKLFHENATLRDQIQKMEFELNKYRQMEETINNSLILAQQTAEEYKQNARREAELTLNEAKQKIAAMLNVYQDVIKRLNIYNAELKAQLSGQLEMLDKSQQRVEELSTFFYGKDLKELLEDLEAIKMEVV
ncbi:MAG: DivIVA domain-containing protein [Syntrophomonadaceae bacterium]|jgi:cell division initiation protein|nr:DivIVA domain-containing protein [Syntrophomonadaceae bacterium]